MRDLRAFALHWLLGITLICGSVGADDAKRPNVLFIAMDDLNDWIGCLGGHPQTRTPNLDRLAAQGILFRNAHCPAPACNPCRSAIFTGRAPNRSGMYDNRQQMREVMPDAELIPAFFHRHGYRAVGGGKLLHYFIDAKSWDDYFPAKETENPLPETFYPKKRPVSLPRGGPWQYVETDWGALNVSDEQFGGDWSVSKFIGEQLQQEHAQPLFLACGLYRPHEPWFVPKRYFRPFPLRTIQLPPGYRADDLTDVPSAGKQMAKNRYFEHIREQDQWRKGIQGYLASIHFADAMLGRVLKQLEQGPHADNTIVVLWSDHGWQLGEKEHWQKYTPWRAVTRVPLIVVVPPGCSEALPEGTQGGSICDEPVNLLSLFPTLVDVCGLPRQDLHDGPSLLPLLREPRPKHPEQVWPHPSITFLARPGSVAISGRTARYIRYADGSEEAYDTMADPYEWDNLLSAGQNQKTLPAEVPRLREAVPQEFAERVAPSIASLVKLPWNALDQEEAPASQPVANPFQVYFVNRRAKAVELLWMQPEGGSKSYGTIAAGATQAQQTRPGAVWMIRAAESQQTLGYFRVDDRSAQAIVPAASTAKQ